MKKKLFSVLIIGLMGIFLIIDFKGLLQVYQTLLEYKYVSMSNYEMIYKQ